MEQSRWRSPVAWAGVAALVSLVAKHWFGFEIPGWDEIVDTVLIAGTAFGLFNNPTSKTTY